MKFGDNMNSKRLSRIITISVLIIVFVAIVLLLNNHDDTGEIELIGNSKITINKYSQYMEPGYNIINNNSNGFYVNTEGTVDTTKAGTYYLKYLLYNKNGILVSSSQREIIVLGDVENNSSIYLNGSDEEYFFINEYYDKGATFYENGIDISNRIIIEDNVKKEIPGIYYVKYKIDENDINKEIVRKVHILDGNIIKNIDYENHIINLLINSNNYLYTILPNGIKNDSKNISFNYRENTDYSFEIYLDNNLHSEYIVTIDNTEIN